MDISELLGDPEYRESLAESAYLRERAEEAAMDREHDLAGASYWVLAWGSLSDHAKRPYRSAVAEALDDVLALVASA